jgi:antitoxin (DNA-binding transcriptional repressor) of toxin-antitoxin stability system
MRTLTVADIETHFSDIIGEVINGEKIQIFFDTSKEPVAMIVPVQNQRNSRKIGVLDGKALFKINGDSKISEEEFLGI